VDFNESYEEGNRGVEGASAGQRAIRITRLNSYYNIGI
jgi:hypothetical protein